MNHSLKASRKPLFSYFITVKKTSIVCLFLPLKLPTLKMIFFQNCAGHETLFNVCRTSETKHHKAYFSMILRKKMLTRKLKKIPGIAIVNALRAKIIKMVAEAVEKMQNKRKRRRKRAIILSIHHCFYHVCTNTSSSSKKCKKVSQSG